MLKRMINKADDSNNPLEGTKNILFAVIILSAIFFIAPELMGSDCPTGFVCLDDVTADTCATVAAESGTVITAPSGTDVGKCEILLSADNDNAILNMTTQIDVGIKAVLNILKWIVLVAGGGTVAAMRVRPRPIQHAKTH